MSKTFFHLPELLSFPISFCEEQRFSRWIDRSAVPNCSWGNFISTPAHFPHLCLQQRAAENKENARESCSRATSSNALSPPPICPITPSAPSYPPVCPIAPILRLHPWYNATTNNHSKCQDTLIPEPQKSPGGFYDIIKMGHFRLNVLCINFIVPHLTRPQNSC